MNPLDLAHPAIPPVTPLAVGEREAARLIGVSARTMFNWRATGTGPRSVKIGGRVLYAVDELRRWLSVAAGDARPTVQAETPAPGGGQ